MSDIDKAFDAHWEMQTSGSNQWSTLERLAAKEAFQAGFNCALHQQEQAEPVASDKPIWFTEDNFGRFIGTYDSKETAEQYARLRTSAFLNNMPYKATPLYRHPLSAVPVGWKLVPVEPTKGMEDSASMALNGSIGGYESGRVLRAWDAMLSAAPQPKETGE